MPFLLLPLSLLFLLDHLKGWVYDRTSNHSLSIPLQFGCHSELVLVPVRPSESERTSHSCFSILLHFGRHSELAHVPLRPSITELECASHPCLPIPLLRFERHSELPVRPSEFERTSHSCLSILLHFGRHSELAHVSLRPSITELECASHPCLPIPLLHLGRHSELARVPVRPSDRICPEQELPVFQRFGRYSALTNDLSYLTRLSNAQLYTPHVIYHHDSSTIEKHYIPLEQRRAVKNILFYRSTHWLLSSVFALAYSGENGLFLCLN